MIHNISVTIEIDGVAKNMKASATDEVVENAHIDVIREIVMTQVTVILDEWEKK